MQSSLEEKRQFLLNHPNYILDHVSLRFPLTLAQLRKYRKILSWDLITSNTSIAWSTDIIDDFTAELFPKLHPDELPEFSVNDSLPWDSIEFVKRYEHLWDWQAIAENNMLRGKCEEHFRDRLEQQGEYYQPYTELDEDYESVFDSNYSSEDKNKPQDDTWTVERLNDFHRNNGDYDELLFIQNIAWTLPLLKRFIELWGSTNLYHATDIWDTLFAEFNEEETWMGVLDEINRKNTPLTK